MINHTLNPTPKLELLIESTPKSRLFIKSPFKNFLNRKEHKETAKSRRVNSQIFITLRNSAKKLCGPLRLNNLLADLSECHLNLSFGVEKVISSLSDSTLRSKFPLALKGRNLSTQGEALCVRKMTTCLVLRWAIPIVNVFRPVRGCVEYILHDGTLATSRQRTVLLINPET